MERCAIGLHSVKISHLQIGIKEVCSGFQSLSFLVMTVSLLGSLTAAEVFLDPSSDLCFDTILSCRSANRSPHSRLGFHSPSAWRFSNRLRIFYFIWKYNLHTELNSGTALPHSSPGLVELEQRMPFNFLELFHYWNSKQTLYITHQWSDPPVVSSVFKSLAETLSLTTEWTKLIFSAHWTFDILTLDLSCQCYRGHFGSGLLIKSTRMDGWQIPFSLTLSHISSINLNHSHPALH